MAPPPHVIDVTVPGRDCGKRVGVRVHTARELLEENVGRRERLPVAAPAQTVLDMARALDAEALERCVNEALPEATIAGLARVLAVSEGT